MNYPIVKTIENLKTLQSKNPNKYIFEDGAGVMDIIDLEAELGIELPNSYKIFLNNFNGGFIDGSFQQNENEEVIDIDSKRWNSVSLFSLQEIMEVYTDKSQINWKLFDTEYEVYPFIPFCRTSIGELLIFVNSKEESPVFDAFHEEFPNSWGKLYDNFTNLFKDLISQNGNIITTSYDSPSAAEYLELIRKSEN
jgi:hypothetical protein